LYQQQVLSTSAKKPPGIGSSVHNTFGKAFKVFWLLRNSRGRTGLNIKTEAKYIFVVIAAFFVFQLFLFAKSFPAEYNLYFRYIYRLQTSDPFWTSFWFSSELIGEVGLALRFVGACSALAFALLLVRKGRAIFSHLRRAVLLEGAYYLFNLPFIISLFARPNTSTVNVEAGLSYALQILFVSPAFLILHSKMKKPNISGAELYRWGAVAVVGFTFGLWVKHFLLNLYALPISLSDPVLVVGLLNSVFTMLIAGLILVIGFLPVIRKESKEFNSKLVGLGQLLIGIYILVYLLISFLNARYMSFLGLTDLWVIAFLISGVCFIRKH
jgi:hypothetical protein